MNICSKNHEKIIHEGGLYECPMCAMREDKNVKISELEILLSNEQCDSKFWQDRAKELESKSNASTQPK